MSLNHQYAEHEGAVYTRYKKTTNGAISGTRLNPFTKSRETFLLMSSFNKFDSERSTLRFAYDTDVLEIYTEQEDNVFRTLNSYLFTHGLIAPYDGLRDSVDVSNSMSDVEISDLAAAKYLKNFEKRIKSITSRATLERVRDMVERADRPVSFIRAIERCIAEM